MESVKLGIYRHFKGNYYLVLGTAQHSETKEVLVVYVPLYKHSGAGMRVRPLSMFIEEVDRNEYKGPRFHYIGQELPEE